MRTFSRLAIIAVFFSLLSPAVLHAAIIDVTVPASPLWTDTGLTLSLLDSVTIQGATGSWTTGLDLGFSGPDGVLTSVIDDLNDEWIINGQHGQLIGAIVPIGTDLNALPRSLPQNDPSLFPVGSGTVAFSGKVGELWLGINDDWLTDSVFDNQGSVTVQVTTVPEPSVLALLLPAAVGTFVFWRRRS